ncbi:MAG: T9SS type A sorting domain-containing protein, partial [Bacteroidia bacterium]
NDSGDQVYTTSMTVNPTTSSSSQILISRSTFNFPSFFALANAVGNNQVFWAAGQALTGNLTASVTGSQFMIASSASGPWVTSIPLTAVGGVVNATPIYVQYTGQASGTQTGTVTVSGGGAASKSISLSGVVRTGATAPTINTPTPTVMNFGNVPVGSGPSTSMTVAISYTNPVGPATITMPAGYEISTMPNYDYTTNMTTGFVGIGFTITAFIRVINPKVPGAISGNMTISMPGATTQSVALSANATMPSQLILSNIDYLSLFTTNPGTPSATQTISVTGTGLAANLDVTAPNNFEVSLSSSSGFASSVSIAPTAGNVAPTTVYARYSRATAGLDAGNVTLSSAGATTQSVYINGDCFGSPTTSVKSVSKENNVSVFPNPSNGIVYVRTSNQTKDLFVTVLDISGKTIFMDRLTSDNEKIDLSIYPSGIYFAGILDGNMNIIAREKIVIAK